MCEVPPTSSTASVTSSDWMAEDLYDKEFVAQRTEGFEQLRDMLAKYTPEYAETITDHAAQILTYWN